MGKTCEGPVRIRPAGQMADGESHNNHQSKKFQDLSGQIFGFLKVIRPLDERKNGYILYACECSCGKPGCKKIVYKASRQLRYGNAIDCGSGPRYKDLTGQRFGMLTVIEKIEKQPKNGHIWWRCHCDCGGEVIAFTSDLTSGNRKSCGCLSRYKELDWVGRKFGELTVLEHDHYVRGIHYWRCRCSCGNETVVRQSFLSSGKTISCGCQRRIVYKKYRHFVDGTCIEAIRGTAGERSAFRNSKSGIRGVYKNKDGKWNATICFRRKTIHLGCFDMATEAREAREGAEKKYFDRTLERWERSRSEGI